MPSTLRANDPTPLHSAWRRLHAALMPDYNRQATVYWWTMLFVGTLALGYSLLRLAGEPAAVLVQVAGGIALALLAALFPVKIPRTNQAFAIGDVFILLLLFGHGPAAGCAAAGLEGLVSSWRSSRRWTTRLGTASIASVTMAVCGRAWQSAIAWLPGALPDHVVSLVAMAILFGTIYAASNALLMSAAARLKRNEPLRLSDFVSVFGWVGLASAGSSAIAALLLIIERFAGLGMMVALLPTFGLLLTTLHLLGRQQEAAAQALQHKADLATSQARQQHLQELETAERRFQSAFTHASIGMALVSADGAIQLANPALGHFLGVDNGELVGQRFGDFVSVSDVQGFHLTLARIASGIAEPAALELGCRRVDGCEVWANISCSIFSEPGAAHASLILQILDITARRRAEAELHHRAFHDKLTGLPNRERFHEALAAAIDQGSAGESFAVLFLDFDRFKLINDSKGHGVGDEFLVQASRRLMGCLRRGDILARLGGDEFAILVTGLNVDADAVDLAERLQQALRDPLRLSTLEIAATASIGITFSSMGYTRPEDMLRDADIAMYRAKQDGKARYALFDVTLHKEVANRVRLEGDLRQALAQQGLSIAFQPLFDLVSGRLEGFEALGRWNHHELGPVSPKTFIPIAEESALITGLTEFMIQGACRHLRQWLTQYPGNAHLHVHVNAAGRDLADAEFVSRIRRALQSTGLAPQHLVIELTENILMSQLSAALGTLEALRELGVRLSVDDFGTGYSSLSHLSRLPIDSLKIDMSFVRRLSEGSKEAAVIRAIVLLGTSLGKTIVAEGIETHAQMDQLRELGCHVGQGYYLSRPLLADGVDQLLRGLPTAQAARSKAARTPQPLPRLIAA